MKNYKDVIKNGRQIGASFFRKIENENYYFCIGIQFFDEKYVSHVSMIKESNMVSENYEIEKTVRFEQYDQAIEFIAKCIGGIFHEIELKPSKGQKFFNPNFAEDPPHTQRH